MAEQDALIARYQTELDRAIEAVNAAAMEVDGA